MKTRDDQTGYDITTLEDDEPFIYLRITASMLVPLSSLFDNEPLASIFSL